MNLILIGFMGTGKTTLGRKLAKELSLNFIDTDAEVERVCGMSISDIFRKYGETRFRSEEAAAIRRVCQQDGQVIATGGGAILDQHNFQLIKTSGLVVCLTADLDVICERTSRRNSRPLLRGEDLREKVARLLAERQELYAMADYTIDTSVKSVAQLTTEVAELYRQACFVKEGV